MEKLQIEYVPFEELKEYKHNAKEHPQEQVEQIARSIAEFGMNDPIAIDESNVIIEGHGRLMAVKLLAKKGEYPDANVPVIRLEHLTDQQKKAYILAHNKLTMNTGFDLDILNDELAAITEFDMSDFGFLDEAAKTKEQQEAEDIEAAKRCLADDFIVPPFSVLDASQGYWQERKKILNKALRSTEGRKEGLLGGLGTMCDMVDFKRNPTGTSEFDPVLCEILERWFCPEHGIVFDPFAGGSTRGLITSLIGNEYIGMDISEGQVEANRAKAQQFGCSPVWICDDSQNADRYIEDNTADMVLTCPPYFDLEKYSDDPRDLSNMSYEEFLRIYESILSKAIHKLKDDRFIAVVIGNVRNKKNGVYRNLVAETQRIFEENGAAYYNDIVFLQQICSLALRAGNQFNASRKVGKRHENVIVGYKKKDLEQDLTEFQETHETRRMHENIIVGYKGDTKNIKQNFPPLDYSDLDIAAELGVTPDED